ncbi:MAG: LysM peptidoglycan-binding domain-containing protein [Alphaproteobacteria bacterium]|nr:LysM peptidoglycan-binding domain-containing protein [Alphaproteobacteria bacterium]
MNNEFSWTRLAELTSERRYFIMRTPVLVAVVVAVHAVAIGSVLFIQGCGTRKPAMVEPPPAPVMPPKQETRQAPEFKPVFHPPVAVEPAPAMAVPSEAKTYTVQNGDSLSKIAVRCGVSVREIMEVNNIKDANRIRIGQKLVLPDYATAPLSMPSVTSKPKSKTKPKSEIPEVAEKVSAEGGSTYVVHSGDSISKIASRHGVKIAALRAANPKLKGDKILIGQKLVIPGAASATHADASPVPAAEFAPIPQAPIQPSLQPLPSVPAPAPAMPAVELSAPVSQTQPLDYTVQDGDTLESIAKLFIVRKEDIMTLNGITDLSTLMPGMKLKIPSTR